MTKSTKSQQGECSSLLYISSPVSATPTNALRALVHSPRARVSRASHAWRVRAAMDKAKVGGFTAPRNLILPRVRTYHTKKPSRFVHALSARPLKNGWRGRGWSECADGTESVFFIFDVCCTPTLSCRGRRRRRPVKNHNVTFLLSYFCMTKSTKSHQRERSPLFENLPRVHEFLARAMRGKCVRQRTK